MNKFFGVFLLMSISYTAMADWESVSCVPVMCVDCAIECTIRENGTDYVSKFTQKDCSELKLEIPGDRALCAKRVEICIKESPVKKISELHLICE